MKNLLIRLAATMLMIVSMSSNAAEQSTSQYTYLGLGLSRFSIESRHPSIDDQSISGISLLWGLRNNHHVFELSVGGGSGVDVGPTPDIYYPEDSADYAVLTLSYQYLLRDLPLAQQVYPYIGIGYSFNSINWESYVYDHSGEGLTFMGGVLFDVDKNWAINATLRRYSFSGSRLMFTESDYPDYDTQILELGVIAEYHF